MEENGGKDEENTDLGVLDSGASKVEREWARGGIYRPTKVNWPQWFRGLRTGFRGPRVYFADCELDSRSAGKSWLQGSATGTRSRTANWIRGPRQFSRTANWIRGPRECLLQNLHHLL
jgi:hypothetical protein